MTDKSIQLFGSKEYHFLNWLKSQEQKTSRGTTINFSQEEIAAEYGSRQANVKKWLNDLQSVWCVEQKKKGSYRVTKTGDAVIAQMGKIEKLIGGNKNG